MNPHFERAMLLFEQGRTEQAEKELRHALAAEPHDAHAHAVLALCLSQRDRYEEATHEALEAVGLAPELSFAHYALSTVYYRRNRLKEARAAIAEAIRFEPYDPANYAHLAAIELDLRNWPAALAAAEKGLEVDSQHVGCTNLRVRALAQLGRKLDAAEAVQAALERDPDSSVTHANRGWTLLEQGQPAKAMEHFRESLRLDPEMDWARAGIVEALKARHFLYRWMLGYFFWMSRLSAQVQWGILVGGYLGFRFLGGYAEDHPQAAPFIRPLLVAYVIFAVLTWVARPVFNSLLRLNKFGRMVLDREQVVESNWVMASLLPALACGVAYAFITAQPLRSFILMIAGITLGITAILTAGTFVCAPGWPRRTMALCTAGYFLLGATAVGFAVSVKFAPDPFAVDERIAMAFRILNLLGPLGLVLQFTAGILAGITPKK